MVQSVLRFGLDLQTRANHLGMKNQIFEKYDGNEVTDSMLQEAPLLFNENHGVWGKEAVKLGAFTKPGKSAQIYLALFH